MPSTDRYIKNNSTNLLQADAHENLLASLDSIVTHSPPDPASFPSRHSYTGLYYGPTSIGYLFLRLSSFYPAATIHNRSLLAWGASYLSISPASSATMGTISSSHCGVANEQLTHTAVAAMLGRREEAERLCGVVEDVVGEGGSDEWLYGRAGYLYLLRLAREGFPVEGGEDGEVRALIQGVAERVIDRILQSPLPWTWHGSVYLGAAHGAIGIILQIILTSPSRATVLQSTLSNLLATQFPSGNFPSSLPPHSDKLVQFCHGAPGFIISLSKLKPHFPQLASRIDDAIERAEACVWERGLLTKEPCLCHGVTGNALAINEKREFEHFLGVVVKGRAKGWWATGGGEESGLFTGEAGNAWVWAVADTGMEKMCIGYSDF
ncbi:MAG: hypothetical protein M1813_008915 [Trichoglossum hirsutum]|nr:MAG: hypothetical protein M1813_008915 [Trichoglossum hirsutum]